MLAVTSSAQQAIQGLTSQPGVPEGSGLKLSAQETPQGMAIELALAGQPEESDQIVEATNVKVFVAAPLADLLDDKVLDAEVQEDKIAFSLTEQPPTA